MAIQKGGLLGRPSGSIAGIVFGAARSRAGKIVTAREKVSPSNPNTPAQQTQRGLFARALDVAKRIGPGIYSDDYNRAVSQLPGFQSTMSLLLSNTGIGSAFSAPPDVPLGQLHIPATIAAVAGAATGEIDVTWSTEVGDNGTVTDSVVVFAYPALQAVGAVVAIDTSETRATGASGITLSGLVDAENYVVCVYLRGAGDADGLLSLARYQMSEAG